MGVVLMEQKLTEWAATSLVIGGVALMVGSDVLATTRRFRRMSAGLELWGSVWVLAGTAFLAQQADV